MVNDFKNYWWLPGFPEPQEQAGSRLAFCEEPYASYMHYVKEWNHYFNIHRFTTSQNLVTEFHPDAESFEVKCKPIALNRSQQPIAIEMTFHACQYPGLGSYRESPVDLKHTAPVYWLPPTPPDTQSEAIIALVREIAGVELPKSSGTNNVSTASPQSSKSPSKGTVTLKSPFLEWEGVPHKILGLIIGALIFCGIVAYCNGYRISSDWITPPKSVAVAFYLDNKPISATPVSHSEGPSIRVSSPDIERTQLLELSANQNPSRVKFYFTDQNVKSTTFSVAGDYILDSNLPQQLTPPSGELILKPNTFYIEAPDNVRYYEDSWQSLQAQHPNRFSIDILFSKTTQNYFRETILKPQGGEGFEWLYSSARLSGQKQTVQIDLLVKHTEAFILENVTLSHDKKNSSTIKISAGRSRGGDSLGAAINSKPLALELKDNTEVSREAWVRIVAVIDGQSSDDFIELKRLSIRGREGTQTNSNTQ